MSGRVGNLNEQQDRNLEEFRSVVEDVLTKSNQDDYFLLRWLRARNFNVPKAEKMLRDHISWREQMDVDNICDNYVAPEVIEKYYPGGMAGHDKEGCPIWIIPYGQMDMKGLFHSVKKTDFIKYVIRIMETCEKDIEEQSEIKGRKIETWSVIFDLENFSLKQFMWKPGLDMVLQLVKMYEENYPERLKKAYVVNAPKIFSAAYALIKPLLTDETARKIHVYPNSSWKQYILEDIDESELPQNWGGTKTDEDGDPKCPSLINPGGFVPCSHYTAPSRRLSNEDDMQISVIQKKSVLPIEFQVPEVGTIITWEFKTENYDIGFSVVFKPAENCTQNELDGGNKEKEVVAMHRVNCHLVPEDGAFKCEKIGTYTLKFDNSFSWCRSKKLIYKIQVHPPPDSTNLN